MREGRQQSCVMAVHVKSPKVGPNQIGGVLTGGDR